jgi:hypothetical protein
MPVPAERRSRGEVDPDLDDLASGDAEIVALETGAPDALLLSVGQLRRQAASGDQRRPCQDSRQVHAAGLIP